MAGRYTSYDELPDVERQKVAQFAAGNAGGNANVSRALAALSANPAYALQMMQRAGLNAGADSTTSDSAREINWSDTVNRSMQDGGADIAPERSQPQTAPVPPVRSGGRSAASARGAGGNAAGEEHTVVGGYANDVPQPPRRPVELGGTEPQGEDSGYSMNGIIMAALAAAAGQQMYARSRGRGAPQMQLPPEAGGAAPVAQDRFAALDGPPEQRRIAGPAPKQLPPGVADDVEDAAWRDAPQPKQVTREKTEEKPKSDSEKTLDKSLDDDGQSKRKKLEAPVDEDDGVQRTLNRRERAAKAVRDSTRKVKLKK